jgi:hypothetical protein
MSAMTADERDQWRRDTHAAFADLEVSERYRPGDDREALRAQCLAEIQSDPYYEQFFAIAEAAPSPEEWDPDRARELRRLFRGALAWACQWGRGSQCYW